MSNDPGSKRKARKKKKKRKKPKTSKRTMNRVNSKQESDGSSGYEDIPNGKYLIPGVSYEFSNPECTNIRCTAKHDNKDQCKRPARQGYIYCEKHAGRAIVGSGQRSLSHSTKGALYRFETERWDQFYADCLLNPEWNDLIEEVALVRTAAQLTLEVARKRIDAANTQEDETLKTRATMTAAGLLTEMATNVAEIVDKAAKVQKAVGRTIDVRHVDVFLENLVGILAQEIDDVNILSRIAIRMRGATIPTDGHRNIADWPSQSPERAAFDQALRGKLKAMDDEADAAARPVDAEVVDA